MIFTILGIASGVLFLIGDFRYFTDTLQGVTQPQRVTWGVAFLLNIIGFANQLASGADNSLWLFGAAALATGAIFITSLKKGVGGGSKIDIFSITTSLIGIGLWIAFDSPLLSILASVIVAVIMLIPTIIKAKKDPESETRIAWLLATISAALATISVGELDFQLLLLPAVATILQGYMTYILYFWAKREVPKESAD